MLWVAIVNLNRAATKNKVYMSAHTHTFRSCRNIEIWMKDRDICHFYAEGQAVFHKVIDATQIGLYTVVN